MIRLNLGVFASHGGSNMQAVADACRSGELNAKVCVVICNNADAYVLKRALNENIPCYHLSGGKYPDERQLDKAMIEVLDRHSVDTVILAGYMKKLGHGVLRKYRGRILNIHPALLPKHSGKGMYGKYVHEAVIDSGDKVTGVTVHLVDEGYDTGKIINQCEMEVLPDDTADTLAKRVLEKENVFYVETLKMICEGKIKL